MGEFKDGLPPGVGPTPKPNYSNARDYVRPPNAEGPFTWCGPLPASANFCFYTDKDTGEMVGDMRIITFAGDGDIYEAWLPVEDLRQFLKDRAAAKKAKADRRAAEIEAERIRAEREELLKNLPAPKFAGKPRVRKRAKKEKA